MNAIKYLLLTFMITAFILPMSVSADWELAQEFNGTITYDENLTVPSGFVLAQEFNGQISNEEVYDPPAIFSTYDPFEVMIWLIILWLPALLIGYYAPGYGTMMGLLMMGGVFYFIFTDFIWMLLMMIVCSAILFWRGI